MSIFSTATKPDATQFSAIKAALSGAVLTVSDKGEVTIAPKSAGKFLIEANGTKKGKEIAVELQVKDGRKQVQLVGDDGKTLSGAKLIGPEGTNAAKEIVNTTSGKAPVRMQFPKVAPGRWSLNLNGSAETKPVAGGMVSAGRGALTLDASGNEVQISDSQEDSDEGSGNVDWSERDPAANVITDEDALAAMGIDPVDPDSEDDAVVSSGSSGSTNVPAPDAESPAPGDAPAATTQAPDRFSGYVDIQKPARGDLVQDALFVDHNGDQREIWGIVDRLDSKQHTLFYVATMNPNGNVLKVSNYSSKEVMERIASDFQRPEGPSHSIHSSSPRQEIQPAMLEVDSVLRGAIVLRDKTVKKIMEDQAASGTQLMSEEDFTRSTLRIIGPSNAHKAGKHNETRGGDDRVYAVLFPYRSGLLPIVVKLHFNWAENLNLTAEKQPPAENAPSLVSIIDAPLTVRNLRPTPAFVALMEANKEKYNEALKPPSAPAPAPTIDAGADAAIPIEIA